MKVAIMGYARAGKDTVAQMIKDNYEYGYKMVSMAFGDELKETVHSLFDTGEKKPREVYEQFAKGCREIDENVWINALARRYGKLMTLGYEDFVITDLRQPNEAEFALQNGFFLVEVRSTDVNREERSVGDSQFNRINESEKLLHTIKPHVIIYNNNSLEDLETRVKSLVRNIKEEQVS